MQRSLSFSQCHSHAVGRVRHPLALMSSQRDTSNSTTHTVQGYTVKRLAKNQLSYLKKEKKGVYGVWKRGHGLAKRWINVKKNWYKHPWNPCGMLVYFSFFCEVGSMQSFLPFTVICYLLLLVIPFLSWKSLMYDELLIVTAVKKKIQAAKKLALRITFL